VCAEEINGINKVINTDVCVTGNEALSIRQSRSSPYSTLALSISDGAKNSCTSSLAE